MINKIIELYKRYKELINYLIVGVLTTVVSLGVYYGSVLTFFNPDNPIQLQLANILSWIAAVTFAYFANRKYVFESKDSKVFKEVVKFYMSRISTLIMDMVIMFVGVTVLAFDDKIVKIVVQVIVTVANYVLSKLFVFSKKGK